MTRPIPLSSFRLRPRLVDDVACQALQASRRAKAEGRMAKLHRSGWRPLVLDRYARALRRGGVSMKCVTGGPSGPVWYAPEWAVELHELPLEDGFMQMAARCISEGLDPDAALAAHRLGGAVALQALLVAHICGPDPEEDEPCS